MTFIPLYFVEFIYSSFKFFGSCFEIFQNYIKVCMNAPLCTHYNPLINKRPTPDTKFTLLIFNPSFNRPKISFLLRDRV